MSDGPPAARPAAAPRPSLAARWGALWGSLGGAVAQRPRLRRAGEALLLAVPVLVFVRGLLPHPSYLGAFGDARTFHFWWTVTRHTLLRYGELPFWNPYECGGMVHWGNVQSMILAPTTLLSLVFDPGTGMRVHVLAHFLAGFWGCWALAGQRGLRGPWRAAPGVVFVFGANFVERATGHIGFLPFLLLPWLAWAHERARLQLRWALVCGALIAYCVFAGAPYPFVFFCAYLGLLVAWDAGSALWARAWGRAGRAAALGALALATAAGLSAVQLFVVVDFMSEYPRAMHETDYLAPWQAWEVFLEAPLTRHRKGYFYVFGEYRNYLGPIAVAAVPLMLLRLRQHARDYFLLAVALALMLGNFGPWSPYAVLSRLPVFGSLRVPVRWALIADLHIALLFGHALAAGAAAAAGAAPRRRAAALGGLGVVLALCCFDLMAHNASQLPGFYRDPPVVPPRAGPFRMVPGDPHVAYQGPERNEGHLRCNEPNPLRISPALRGDMPQEAWLVEGSGSATVVDWSPNRMTIQVPGADGGAGAGAIGAPRRLAINMNYHRDWNVSGGTLEPYRGLLGVLLAPGSERVELWYRPRRIGWYAAVSLLTAILALWAWRAQLGAGWGRTQSKVV